MRDCSWEGARELTAEREAERETDCEGVLTQRPPRWTLGMVGGRGRERPRRGCEIGMSRGSCGGAIEAIYKAERGDHHDEAKVEAKEISLREKCEAKNGSFSIGLLSVGGAVE